MENTKKIYYESPLLMECTAKVMHIYNNGVILDQTVAFPEGGGQVGDTGKILNLTTKKESHFIDTRKIKGRTIFLENFPVINVEGQISHIISENEIINFAIGDEVIVKLNEVRRKKISLHHSALHLVLYVLEKIRLGLDKNIVGAKINENYGRLDFRTEDKFSQEELEKVRVQCQKLIDEKHPILIYSHKLEKEALYWKCLEYCVPCGGTHCNNIGELGVIKIKRKNIGKGIDRIIVEVDAQQL